MVNGLVTFSYYLSKGNIDKALTGRDSNPHDKYTFSFFLDLAEEKFGAYQKEFIRASIYKASLRKALKEHF